MGDHKSMSMTNNHFIRESIQFQIGKQNPHDEQNGP